MKTIFTRNRISALVLMALWLQACSHRTTVSLTVNQTRLKLRMPQTMRPSAIGSGWMQTIYKDEEHGVLMEPTIRSGRFHSVDEYLNCSWADLEKRLGTMMEDTTFRLAGCDKTRKATILSYTVRSGTDNYPNHIMYFLHKDRSDIQVGFSFADSNMSVNHDYANSIMRTARLN